MKFIEFQPCTKEGEAIDGTCFVRADQIVGVRRVTESDEVSFIRTRYGGTHYVQYRPQCLVNDLERLWTDLVDGS
jgi:hypothetical protein